MQALTNEIRLTARLVDSLYLEALVLADEVRGYFDQVGRVDRETLPPLQRVAFSCESLKVTTRLMHVIAWLLTRRALEQGEISMAQAHSPSRRLGVAADSDPATMAMLPEQAQILVEASRDLYVRVERLDQDIDLPMEPVPSPARSLLSRLERAF